MELKEIFRQRRSINFFDPDRDVTEHQLREIIEMAANAPSSFNLQPWNLIILRDPDAQTRLRKLAWDQPKVTEAPVVLIFLADRNGWQSDHPTTGRVFEDFVRLGTMKEEQHQWFLDATKRLYGNGEPYRQAFANKNTAFFAMSVMLAAKASGIDTHPMDGFDHDAVRKEFAIPENFWIPLLMAVGYSRSDKVPLPPKWRKSYDDIVINQY